MYYPKSQIEINLYTAGGEFVIKNTNQPYVGFYWKTSNGKVFTGKTPDSTLYKELIKIQNSEEYVESYPNNKLLIALPFDSPVPNVNDNVPFNEDLLLKYLDLNNTDFNNLPSQQLPTYSPTLPTEEDYKIGEFERYFCVKRNQNVYLEIKKDIYNKLTSQNNQIAWQLYKPFKLSWAITGVRDNVYLTNKSIVALTSQRNQLVGLNLYLKEDYLKYYNG